MKACNHIATLDARGSSYGPSFAFPEPRDAE
jgi:hypothetical protein